MEREMGWDEKRETERGRGGESRHTLQAGRNKMRTQGQKIIADKRADWRREKSKQS